MSTPRKSGKHSERVFDHPNVALVTVGATVDDHRIIRRNREAGPGLMVEPGDCRRFRGFERNQPDERSLIVPVDFEINSFSGHPPVGPAIRGGGNGDPRLLAAFRWHPPEPWRV